MGKNQSHLCRDLGLRVKEGWGMSEEEIAACMDVPIKSVMRGVE